MYEIFRLYNDNSNQGEYWVKDEQYNNLENYLLKIQDNKLENDEALENRFNNKITSKENRNNRKELN